MQLDGEKDYIPKKLGTRIKQIRNDKNIAEEIVEVECGISKSYLSDIENGRIDVPYLVLNELAACFKITMTELIDNI